ncbi:glutamine amidotransferase-like class 1 domain-containing protein 1 isoform X5 [Scyliorhinus canicula]|uniref:glutamine amidotransferase-like class 1 domain-containing protein 1 isoform X5 n=1 Tax=Scyliorhinus canicula TaxID=7830 RepID=UPI0018F47E54|nr:glutamine amidotransferase-like class 1 domain-containing protein 1 isoform X5 [Scyliorhinus canicula]
MSAKPSLLIVLSAAAEGVSAQSFYHSYTQCSTAFNLQIATPGGKPMDFVGLDENNIRWIQDFRMKPYANPAKLESIDGARYNAILIPNCPGAMVDLATSGYLAKILQHFCAETKPICVVGHGVSALCCATNQDKSWIFQGYSVTGVSAQFKSSKPDTVHVVFDRHLITGQNDQSTLTAIQNLILCCNARK